MAHPRSGAPEEWRTGPVLEDAAYPDVLVAKAVTDGTALDLVLVPGDGAVRTTIVLGRLRTGTTYRVSTGGTVTAGPDGRAMLEVDLADRLTLRIYP